MLSDGLSGRLIGKACQNYSTVAIGMVEGEEGVIAFSAMPLLLTLFHG
jgi:hypothetical protein